MSKAKVKVVDPTVPATEITLYGVTYKMALTNGALAAAEDELFRRGHSDVSLLQWMFRRSFSTLRDIFAASLMHYQPELELEAARDLVNEETAAEIFIAINGAREKNFPKPEKVDPPQPEPESGETNSGPTSSATPE